MRANVAQDRIATKEFPANMIEVPLEHPDVPETWAVLDGGGVVDWMQMVKGITEEHPEILAAKNKAVLKATLKKVIDPDTVGGTAEQVEQWLPYIK